MQKTSLYSLSQKFINRTAIILSLKNIARKTARSNHRIDQVYLFGSMSTDNAGLHSDADILVVLKEDKRPMLDRIDEYLLKFSDGPVPVDVFVYTKEELEQARREGNSFVRMALKGIKLVGRSRRRSSP